MNPSALRLATCRPSCRSLVLPMDNIEFHMAFCMNSRCKNGYHELCDCSAVTNLYRVPTTKNRRPPDTNRGDRHKHTNTHTYAKVETPALAQQYGADKCLPHSAGG